MNGWMDPLLMACLVVPVTASVYIALPWIFVAKDRKRYPYHAGRTENRLPGSVFDKLPVSSFLRKSVTAKLEEAGLGDGNTWKYWILLTIPVPAAAAVLMLAGGSGFPAALAVSSCGVVLPELYLRGKIAERKKAFTLSAYKLYSFLHSQISSGIKATDAIRELHRIADHPLIHDAFVRFAAHYELTLDIEEALEMIRKSIKGYDADMLCVCIRQCVETGMAGKTLLKMEQLMFAKFFFLLQKETARYRTRLLFAGLLAVVPLMALFALPVIFDAVRGFEQVLHSPFA